MTIDPNVLDPPGRLRVVRPDDLLVLVVGFNNFTVHQEQPGSPPILIGSTDEISGSDIDRPTITVRFPPQSVAEASLTEGMPPDPIGETVSDYSGPSELGFAFAYGVRIPYTLEEVLKACRDNSTVVTFVDIEERALHLEVPYGLMLQPSESSRWEHVEAPVIRGPAAARRTELWHTRLTGDRRVRALEAVSGDAVKNPSLSSHDRNLIVKNTTGEFGQPFEPELLMLTSLGAWLDVRAEWPGATLESWHHRMTMGRDQYVRVVKAGYLFPYGHPAVFVRLTVRKLEQGVGRLHQRSYVVVRQPEVTYSHRAVPFTKVRVLTTVTPDLRPAAESDIEDLGEQAFWVRVGLSAQAAQDLQFHLEAVDHAGRVIELRSPLAFLGRDVAANAQLRTWMTATGAGGFHGSDPAARARRVRHLPGQPVAFAVPNGGRSDSTLETAVLDVGAQVAPAPPGPAIKAPSAAPFLPRLLAAEARIPAVRRLTGSDAPTTAFTYDDAYLDPTKPNPLDLFARLTGGPVGVKFSPEQSGGIVSPNVKVTALSRLNGPVGGTAAELTSGEFNPAQYFAELPKLLGGIALTDIMPANVIGTNGADVPKVVSLDTPELVETTLTWETTNLKSQGIFTNEGSVLSLKVRRLAPKKGGAATTEVTGTLTGFSISLPATKPLIKIPFQVLSFHAEVGKKVDVGVKLGQVTFDNELAFVNALSRIIPAGGFEDPPALDVTAEGVRAGYSLAVPSVGVGAFNLQNLTLLAGFHLPFLGPASVVFGVSERHHPFIVTYSAIGGGGFLLLEMGVDGEMGLEAAIEVGGAVALNIGVASGGVSITAGVYYARKAGVVELAGFVRCVGILEVLGLISVSVEFYLQMGFVGEGANAPKLAGSATLRVKVKVVFFSKTVSLTVSREFPKGSDPTFEQVVSQQDWERYCLAFGKE